MNIRNNLITYLDDFEYENEIRESVLSNLDKLLKHLEIGNKIEHYTELYQNGVFDFDGLREATVSAAETSGISEMESCFIHMVSLANFALPFFERRGLGKAEWYDSMIDFKWKMRENKKRFGLWGINAEWHKKFFTADRIAFGRLQYNLLDSERTFKGKTVDVTEGQTVVTIHIPSDDRTPFSRENRYSSYVRAENYYRRIVPDGRVIFRCGTWLLNTLHREILPEGSNIRAFLDDFEIDPDSYEVSNGDLWRIFYVNSYNGDPSTLPESSSLMRAYKKHLIGGGQIGKMVGYIPGESLR